MALLARHVVVYILLLFITGIYFRLWYKKPTRSRMMYMTDLLLSPSNLWFSIALTAIAFIAVLELVSMLFGLSLLGIGDEIGETSADGFMGTELASWLNINKVPFLVWLVVFLTCFGLSGITINGISSLTFNTALPKLVSVPAAGILGLFITSKSVFIIAHLLPSVETSAMHSDDFVGAVAQITIGRASRGNPAEAKFTDNFSQPHFVLVEPLEPEELFDKGERVILVQKNPHSWFATRYQ